MKGYGSMNSLAQPSSATIASSKRNRFVGWSAIASGLAFVIVGQKPYFPSSLSLVLLIATLALYLGMVPVARWIASGLVARDSGERARVIRVGEIAGVAGALIAAATAVLALPHWLPAVPAQILNTTALGVIGLWLAVSNALVFRAWLYNRVLAVIGIVAGAIWLLVTVVMWTELMTSASGSAVSALETFRTLGGYSASALYIIWAIWLGVWLLIRRR
jgi:hypothetical protein